MTLEQQLTDLIRKHGLLNISITATVTDGGSDTPMFYASAQALGGDINGRWCGSTDTWKATVQPAVTEAIDRLNAQRDVCDVEFPPMGEAA